MKNFNRFAIRFLAVILIGLLLLLLHGCGFAGNIFTPKYASPWELSKLVYWPLLASALLTSHLSGGMKKTMENAAMPLVVTPMVLFLVFWAILKLQPAGGIYLLLWVVGSVIGAALADQERKNQSVWLVLAVAMGVLYIIFTFLPPEIGPFLDPTDVAAMGTIPC